MRSRTLVTILSVLMVSVTCWVLSSHASAQTASTPCDVSGAKFPELIPEYFAWESHFRFMVASAQTDEDEGEKPLSAPFVTGNVRAMARQARVSEPSFRIVLEVAQKALIKVDALRESSKTAPDARLREIDIEAAELVIEGRDELIRKLPIEEYRAIRRLAPVRGAFFTFPPSEAR